MKRQLTLIITSVFLFASFAMAQNSNAKVMLSAEDLWGCDFIEGQFYGLFQKQQLQESYYRYEVKEINLKDYIPQAASIHDYAKVNSEKVKKEGLDYILAGFDSLPEIIDGWKPEHKFLMPGDSLSVGQYEIFVKGEIAEDGIKNYRMGVKATFENITTEQIIEHFDHLEPSIKEYGGLLVDWVGDLDGDGKNEVLLLFLGHSECYQMILFSPGEDFKFHQIYTNTFCS